MNINVPTYKITNVLVFYFYRNPHVFSTIKNDNTYRGTILYIDAICIKHIKFIYTFLFLDIFVCLYYIVIIVYVAQLIVYYKTTTLILNYRVNVY